MYSHYSKISGIDSHVHENRDFGLVLLPEKKSSFLDQSIGALSIGFLPEQPYEYIKKSISIVGYPGEKEKIEMYHHTGPVRKIDHRGIVYYDVDTSSGNSGSPGFMDFRKKAELRVEDSPVCVVHTHASKEDSLNAGVGIDDDLVEFMKSFIKLR